MPNIIVDRNAARALVKSGTPTKTGTIQTVRQSLPDIPPQQKKESIKGAFWVENRTGETIPACTIVGLRGFASAFATLEDTQNAVKNDNITLRTTGSDYPLANNFAFALEEISIGGRGRAVYCNGSIIYGVVAGSGSVAWNARFSLPFSGENVGKFVTDDEGVFKNVAFDSTTRFIAVCPEAIKPIIYDAGDGVSLDGTTFSAHPSFRWRCLDGSAYQYGNYVNCNQGEMLFGDQFKSASSYGDGANRELQIKTQRNSVLTNALFERFVGYPTNNDIKTITDTEGVYVVTGVDFEKQTVTTKQIFGIAGTENIRLKTTSDEIRTVYPDRAY